MTAPRWTHEGERYGDPLSYEKAASWLGSGPVEDWGGGPGYARRYFPNGYKLVDGTPGYGADVVTDLTGYVSKCEGILMRHVLEHNVDWRFILENALASCKKLALVIFTPFTLRTHIIVWNNNVDPPVPDISFAREDLTSVFPEFTEESFPSDTQYGMETIFYVQVRA